MCRWVIVPLIAMALLPSCEQGIVEGRVTNEQDETLPGVVVSIRGTEHQTMTTALGQYRMLAPPGPLTLDFIKTGYTPGQSGISVEPGRVGQVSPVTLWQLPQAAGVYLVEGAVFHETVRATPRRFSLENGDIVYATRREVAVVTQSAQPMIVAYRAPRYDARLVRLRQEQATLGIGEANRFPVWTAAGSRSVEMVALDEAQQVLLRVVLNEPLEPGAYALHWGALEGYGAIEKQIFMFKVEQAIAKETDSELVVKEAMLENEEGEKLNGAQ